jgi:hypothetical protein
MDFDLELVGVVFILAFCAVFLSAWNFAFPTTVERDIWRVASIFMLSYGFVGSLWMELCMWIFVPQHHLTEGFEPSLVEQELARRPHPVQDWHHRFQQWRKSRKGNMQGRRNLDEDGLVQQRPAKGIFDFLKTSHNISHTKDPYMGVQVGFLTVTSVLCILYCVFRVFIFVEDFIGLRALPPSAYETVEWTKFIPHI